MLLNCRLAASWCGLFAALASIRGSAQTIGVAFPVVLVNTPTLTPTHRKRSHSTNYSVHRLPSMACDTHSFLQRFHCPAHLDLGSFLPSMLALALVRCRSIHSSCAKRLPHSCASASTSRCRHFRANKRVYTRWIFTPALPHSSWPRTSKRWAVVSTYSTEVVVCTPPRLLSSPVHFAPD